MFVLVLFHIFGNLSRETLQVGIHRCITVIMRDIQYIAISVWRHSYAADIAIRHSIYLLAFHALGLDVETRMEVVGAKFAESGRKVNRDVDRLAVFRKLLGNHSHGDR